MFPGGMCAKRSADRGDGNAGIKRSMRVVSGNIAQVEKETRCEPVEITYSGLAAGSTKSHLRRF